MSQARFAGLNVTSLVPSVAPIADHIDLVVKQQITAVAGIAEATARHPADTRALHYGVWEIPISGKLPLVPTWFGSGKRSLWRSIH